MKLGIFYGGGADVDSHIKGAVDCEKDGFDSIWYGQIFGVEALTAIALAGRETSTVQFGTSVVPTYVRHPTIMAQQALTTQAATNGRFSLGIGLSHAPVVEGMWGLSYERPAVHMREYLTIVRELIDKGTVSFSGEFFRVNAQAAVPAPKPLPVLIAALAPVMLKMAGGMADGTILWMTGPKTIESYIKPRITEAASEAGRPDPRIVACLPVAVCDNADEARDRAAGLFAVYGNLPNYQRVLQKEGVSGPRDVVIAGTETEVEQGIRDLAAAGATEFGAAMFPVGDDSRASLARTRELLKSLVGKV